MTERLTSETGKTHDQPDQPEQTAKNQPAKNQPVAVIQLRDTLEDICRILAKKTGLAPRWIAELIEMDDDLANRDGHVSPQSWVQEWKRRQNRALSGRRTSITISALNHLYEAYFSYLESQGLFQSTG